MAKATRQAFYSQNGGVAITLDLSEEEASVIRTLLTVAGGDPVKSLRKHANSIKQTLDEVNVKHLESHQYTATGAVHFRDIFIPGYFRYAKDEEEISDLEYFYADPGVEYVRVNITPEMVKDVKY